MAEGRKPIRAQGRGRSLLEMRATRHEFMVFTEPDWLKQQILSVRTSSPEDSVIMVYAGRGLQGVSQIPAQGMNGSSDKRSRLPLRVRVDGIPIATKESVYLLFGSVWESRFNIQQAKHEAALPMLHRNTGH